MIWKPNVTVASILESDGRFLMVEEHTPEGTRINQPAGHLEPGESIPEAAVRETLEESAYHFEPGALVGIYQWRKDEATYLRFAFTGSILSHHSEQALDEGIIRALWLTPDAILADAARHRSPMVGRCIQDYLAGKRYSLDILTHFQQGAA